MKRKDEKDPTSNRGSPVSKDSGVRKKGDIKRGSILIVEEEKALREVLLKMLLSLGYQVTVADSGKEGLEQFQKGSYDLVLTDLTMPSMDGWTLASHMKDKSPNTPICLMTGWAEEEIRPQVAGSAVDFVIFKPFGLHELQEMLKKILNSKP
ncbi:MAG: response regulator [Deltaproteobacteria bacterium]|nr:response regulator [Deltaproteobacteria bacterium]